MLRNQVDMVLAGHAHWKLEFRLGWDDYLQSPLIYYGDFTGGTNFSGSFDELRPFLLQTPAAGPREKFSPDPPYFRRLEIDGAGNIIAAKVMALRVNGTAFTPEFSWDTADGIKEEYAL